MEEEKVDAQKIGQIFVIHYYTQMHQDPSQMHRFYLEHSVFTRGGPEKGMEKPVIGQKAIDEKILSLGLQQVHTKIRQVDSHETISNGIGSAIVVQVTGELSNAGYPMRPFVQTFVLAQESERKYYIHNDIFRYQIYDEDLVSETDGNETGVQTTDQTLGNEDEMPRPHSSIDQEVSLAPPTLSSGETRLVQDDDIVSEHSVKGTSPVPPSPKQVLENTLTTNSWGGDHYEGSTDVPLVGVQTNGLPEVDEPPPIDSPTFPVVMEVNEVVPAATPTTTGPVPSSPDEGEASNKTQTWAAKLKSAKSQSGSSSVQSNVTASTGGKPYSSSSQPPRPSTNLINSSQPLPQREPKQPPSRKPLHVTGAGGGDLPNNKAPFDTKTKSSLPPSNSGFGGGGGQPSSLSSMSRSTPDSHQIFVGNLPNGTKEDELKDVFKSYGNVVEVRINPKNFGFIVFDGEDPVQSIMNDRADTTFLLHERRLNIEEKRPSYQKSFQGGSGGGFGGGGGNNRVFGTNRMQQRGGMVGGSRAPPRR